ncbi:MAG TPA: BadF/BadG/BcrA/BcrD ATPase family protein [Fimbriimonadaceae bacterium]|nr:BadF/BadG/BcrA/BcrD ATPase family protein [Fimbriimonadaceae bacterium]
MRYLLAIDSGGTKCEAVLADETGRVAGRGVCDLNHRPGERHPGGCGRAEETIAQAVTQALREAPTLDELHVAGRRPEPGLLEAMAKRVVYHAIREQDAPMALAGATAGVVVLAGTGAFAYGRAPDGRELLLDALGPLYGDHGGAYQIGLAAVRAAGSASWHERYATSLAEVVSRACRELAGDPADFNMIAYMLDARDRSEIASLARLVNAQANADDRIAREILVAAADDIVETVRCVVERLDLAGDALPLIGTGGVATHSSIYWKRVVERVQGFAPAFHPVLTDRPQVYGLLLGIAAQLGSDSPDFRARLRT